MNSCAGLKSTYRISSVSGISELSGIWWKMGEPGGSKKIQCFYGFWKDKSKKIWEFLGLEICGGTAKF